jgi:hypothetical protein
MLNEILGTAARYQQLLTRRFNLAGGAPSPQLTPEITPVVSIYDQPETRILVGEILASGCIFQAATAAERAVCQLSNPTGSNIVAVVLHLAAHPFGAGATVIGSHLQLGAQAGLPSAGGVVYRDSRTKTNGGVYTRVPTCSLTKFHNPPTIGEANLFLRIIAANLTMEYAQPVVLAPGWAFQVNELDVNVGLQVSFAWVEIPLSPGEVGPF